MTHDSLLLTCLHMNTYGYIHIHMPRYEHLLITTIISSWKMHCSSLSTGSVTPKLLELIHSDLHGPLTLWTTGEQLSSLCIYDSYSLLDHSPVAMELSLRRSSLAPLSLHSNCVSKSALSEIRTLRDTGS